MDRDAAFRQVFAQFGPALQRISASFAKTAEEREDVFQEVAVALWRALPQFQQESSLKTYQIFPQLDLR